MYRRAWVVVPLLLAAGLFAAPTSAITQPAMPGTFTQLVEPRIVGTLRWDHTLTGYYGSLQPVPTGIRYQWFRDGAAISGATGQRYRLRVADFGKRIHLVVVASRSGYVTTKYPSAATAPIDHRVPIRKVFTYRLGYRGTIVADTAAFKQRVEETFADPRGWRAAGIAFKRVADGGSFTVHLAAANTMSTFASYCSSLWSCRAGRNVVINQTRWLHASAPWNTAGLSVRDYQHMVVNHETGHWLGHPHVGCPGAGQPAPVMMQQSKGLNGCSFNPWPLRAEWWTTR